MLGTDPELDERTLVQTLKLLRELVEQEHALEVDRAADVAPLVFDAVGPCAGDAGRTYVFQTASPSTSGGGAALSGGAALRAGDAVEVSSVDDGGSFGFGTITAFTPAGVLVELARRVAPGDLPRHGALRMRVDDNQRAIRLRAIERVVRERHTLLWIGAVLTDATVAPLADTTWDPPAELGVTDGQRRALIGAACCQDVFLIHGPPGTGKTRVIAELVSYFAGQRGARVLLSSKSHRAIDNALERLGAGQLHVLRLGQAEKVTGAGQAVLLADVLAQLEQDVPRRHLAVLSELADMLRSLRVSERLLAQLDGLNREIGESDAAIGQRVADIEDRYTSGLEAIRTKGLRLVRSPETEPEAIRTKGLRLDPPGANGVDTSPEANEQVRSPETEPEAAGPHPIGERGLERRSIKGLLHRGRRLVDRLRPSSTFFRAEKDREVLYRDAEEWVAQRRRQQLGRQDLVGLRDRVAELRVEHQRLMTRAAALLPQVDSSLSGIRVPPLAVDGPDQTQASLSAVRHARRQVEAALPVLQGWTALLERPGALADVLVEAADVIAATAIGVSSGRDGARTADLEFDVAIVDEAAQAQLTDLVVPLSRARTVILVGDHQQLPPYVDQDLVRRCTDKGIDTSWLETSLFEYLWERVPATHRTRLDVQYRMPQVIADFLGHTLYDGELSTAAAKQGGGPVCGLFASAVVLVDTSSESDRGETALSPGFINRCEAHLVAKIVRRLPARYLEGQRLGVIAPYGAQVTAIRQALADVLGLGARDPWLVDNVATVDSFQGQERDVILVSLTRSNAEGAVGFLSDLRRLNVTLSRVREQLVVIGDLSTLCAPGGGPERCAFARFMDDLADHVRGRGEVLDVATLQRRLEGD